jgi:hypothetical protein
MRQGGFLRDSDPAQRDELCHLFTSRCAEPEHGGLPKLNINEEIFRSGTSVNDPNLNTFTSLPIDDVAACHHRDVLLNDSCVMM